MGKVFLIPKHFSLSKNMLLFLTLRSCSRADLVRSSCCREFSAWRSLACSDSTVSPISDTSSTSLQNIYKRIKSVPFKDKSMQKYTITCINGIASKEYVIIVNISGVFCVCACALRQTLPVLSKLFNLVPILNIECGYFPYGPLFKTHIRCFSIQTK